MIPSLILRLSEIVYCDSIVEYLEIEGQLASNRPRALGEGKWLGKTVQFSSIPFNLKARRHG